LDFQFDEKVDKSIVKSVKAAHRFYKELAKASQEKGSHADPPTFENFTSMAKGLMEAQKQLDLEKLRVQSMRNFLEQTWSQKLLNYSTQKLLKDSYEALMKRF
jgi:hypothetical protein